MARFAQRDVQRGALKRRHSDLVQDRLARLRIHLWNQMEARRVPQEPRLNLINRFHPLPNHRRAELGYAHEFFGERHVAREKDANSRLASRVENLKDSVGDLLTILDLPHNPDLHVVHDQSQLGRSTKVVLALAEYPIRMPAA
jgi:hypothetical protein